MNRHLSAAILSTCTLLAIVPVAAQQPADDQALEARFKQLDKNGDGKITTDELSQSAFFKQRDQNGDGAITLAEVKATAVAKPPRTAASSSIRRAPQPLQAAEHGVGRLVTNCEFTDLSGKKHKLSNFAEQRAIVIAMTSTSCPLSKKYLPTLNELAKTYAPQGVAWVLVNPQAADKPEDMRAAAALVAGKALYVHDRQGSLTECVDAQTTADVIVLDAARTVVFHGAIDDQYGFGYALDAPRHRYLADALDAMLAGKTFTVAATDAPGCRLNREEVASATASVTYYNRVSRILQAHCVECHRDDGVAPFPLTTFEQVTDHAAMIGEVIELGTMPPWFAGKEAAAVKGHASPWSNDRSLGAEEKADLLAWIRGGKPKGDERDAPKARTFANEWSIGKPDAVFEFPQAIPVKATGIMPYENILVETHLTEDKWIQAIEIQPGERSVVHHMLVFIHGSDQQTASATQDSSSEANAFWGIYVPGNSTLIYPDGYAKRLPKGARLHCQVHYRPNGKATTDRSRIGVVFANEPPRHEVRVVAVINPRISIPPGAKNHREEAQIRIPADIHVLSFLPHMHLRAKACRYRVTDGSGETRTLLDIPRYDFNWQLLYRYSEPQLLSRGDTLKFTVWYDNSAGNPANPDPTQTVRYGQQISDEMHLGYVEYIVPGDKPGQPTDLSGGRR